MAAEILDGKMVANKLRAEVKERSANLAAEGIQPRLEAIVAGQDPASLAYVRMKRKACEAAGIASGSWEAGPQTTQSELMDQVERLNRDPAVHGVLIQHPLPNHLDESAALMALDPVKDVDGITPGSMGRLMADLPGFHAATPLGMMKLLEHYQIPVEGKQAVVIGRSVILGKPAALLLLRKNATVTIAHSRTRDLPELVRTADIVVAAVGRAEMVRGEWLKPGCVVLDAGYNKVEGRSADVGDVHFESAREVASWITPVPGGVGPMTVACLLANTVEAAEQRR